MHIPYEIQKRLRSARLPQHVLEWIKDKFEEHEKLHQKVEQLEMQLEKSQGFKQYNQGREVGYNYSQKGVSDHYKPWEEDLRYREFYPEYRRGRYSRNDFMNAGVGSGGGGASSYYPQPPRVTPITDAESNQQTS